MPESRMSLEITASDYRKHITSVLSKINFSVLPMALNITDDKCRVLLTIFFGFHHDQQSSGTFLAEGLFAVVF